MQSVRKLWRIALALVFFAYSRNLRQLLILLQQNNPRLSARETVHIALKYASTGQLIACSEYILCLIKPHLAARIGRLLLWRPPDCRKNCCYGIHERNLLDVYGVQERASKPVLVFLHGGAWSFGHKWQYALVGEYLATQGFLVVIMNYRTFPNGSVMDMIEDVENAVLWISQHSSLFGGDRSKVFLSGHSSGGHVGALALVNSALRLACKDTKAVKEKEIVNYVHAFIGFSAPYDISDHYIFESKRILGPFNGVHEISTMKPAMLGIGNFKTHSPTALVEDAMNIGFSLPPFYLLHGENDTVVPTSSSEKFALHLSKAGQSAVYFEVRNCTHEDMAFALMGDTVNCRSVVLKSLKQIMLQKPVSSTGLPPFSSNL